MHHRLKNHLLPYGKGQKYPISQKNRILHPANLTGCLKKKQSPTFGEVQLHKPQWLPPCQRNLPLL